MPAKLELLGRASQQALWNQMRQCVGPEGLMEAPHTSFSCFSRFHKEQNSFCQKNLIQNTIYKLEDSELPG